MFSELLLYTGCVYLISWSCWLFLIWSESTSQLFFWIAGFSPTLVASLLSWIKKGRLGLRELLKLRAAPKAGWYLFCLMGTPLVMVSALLIHRLLGGEMPRLLDPMHLVTSLEQWPGIIIVFLYILVFSALGEEVGWRGYLLPRLIKRVSHFQASLFLGLIWACWHLPLFWLSDTIQSQLPISWFLAQILGSTFIYTWIYLRTEKNIILPILFHTAGNASLGLLPVLPLDNGGSLRPLWLIVGLLWLISILILILERDLFFPSFPKNTSLSS